MPSTDSWLLMASPLWPPPMTTVVVDREPDTNPVSQTRRRYRRGVPAKRCISDNEWTFGDGFHIARWKPSLRVGNSPVWVAGDANRAGFEYLRSVSRRDAVTVLSNAARAFSGLAPEPND